jgi:hypothetical protein
MKYTKEAQKKVSTIIKDEATPDGILHKLSEAIEQQQKLRNIPLRPSSKKAVKDTINRIPVMAPILAPILGSFF